MYQYFPYKKILAIFFVLCGFTSTAYGQAIVSQPLGKVLDSLQHTHKIHFNYLDKLVKNQYINLSDSSAISYLFHEIERQTGLTIQQLDSNNYVLIKASKRVLCGYVMDSQTGEPISNALVYGVNFTTTDNTGYFELQTDRSEISIIIQMIGYEPMKIDNFQAIVSDGCSKFKLKPTIKMLPEVVIHNYMAPGIHKAYDGSLFTEVDPLRVMPGMTNYDVFHSIQFLPGIQSVNEAVSDMNVRGGTPDQNLILFDGVRVYQQGHFFGLISVFNPQTIKKATLIKNATPAKYGDAVSGTILLNSPDQVNDKLEINAGIDMLTADISLDLPLNDKNQVFLSTRRSIGDLIETPTYSSYFERAFADTEVINSSPDASSLANSGIKFWYSDYYLKYLSKVSDKSQLEIFGLYIENDLDFNENAVINNITRSSASSLTQNSLLGSAQYSRKWNDNLYSDFQASLSDYQLKAINSDISANQQLEQLNRVTDLQFKSSNNYAYEAVSGSFGYQYNNLGVEKNNIIDNPGFTSIKKEVISTHALFLENRFVWNKTSCRIGIRTNYYYEPDEFFFEPRLYISQGLGDKFSIELLGEIKSQIMFQKVDLQTDFLGVEKRKWTTTGTEDLFYIINSKQSAIGITYDENDLLINVESYVKLVDNISTMGQGFINQFTDIDERGEYMVLGIDAMIKYTFPFVSTWIGYSYMENNYYFEGVYESKFPSNYDIPHFVTYGASFKRKNIEFASGINWHSGRAYTGLSNDINSSEIYGVPNNERAKDYLRIDTSLKYSFPLKSGFKINAGISVWNLLNHENVINTYYSPNQLGEIEQDKKYALPLTINAILRVKFY